nr:MAG TPA: hypothetical protein [Microviridae sp.]
MIFVIMTDFQHFNKFLTNFSTVLFVLFLQHYVIKLQFSTFSLPLLRLLQQVNIIPRVRACALSRACVHAKD